MGTQGIGAGRVRQSARNSRRQGKRPDLRGRYGQSSGSGLPRAVRNAIEIRTQAVIRSPHDAISRRIRQAADRAGTFLARIWGWRSTVGYKLSASLGLVALLAILAAGVGYYSIVRISTSVGMVADTTSRLLTDAIRVRAVVLGRIRKVSSEVEAMRAIEELHRNGLARFRSMRRHAQAAGISALMDHIESNEGAYVETSRRIVRMSDAVELSELSARGRSGLIDRGLSDLNAAVRGISGVIETRIAETEEKAKVQVQTGTATVDGLGVMMEETATENLTALESTYRAMKIVGQLYEQARLVVLAADQAAIDRSTAEIRQLLVGLKRAHRILMSRLQFIGGDSASMLPEEKIGRLASLMLESRGLVAARVDTLKRMDELAKENGRLTVAQNAYLTELAGLEASVDALNQKFKALAAENLGQGQFLLALLIILAAGSAVAAAWLLMRGIVRPLTALTSHASEVGRSGNPDE